jgi:hypothetical protein
MITMITVITARLSKDRARKHIFPDKVHFPSFFTLHFSLNYVPHPIAHSGMGLATDLKRMRSGAEKVEDPLNLPA